MFRILPSAVFFQYTPTARNLSSVDTPDAGNLPIPPGPGLDDPDADGQDVFSGGVRRPFSEGE